MKPASALLLYVALIFGTAAVLSPLIYHEFSAFWPWPFHRYVDRLLMVSAVGWLPLFWKSFGLFSWRDLGIRWAQLPRSIFWGVLLGGSFAVVVLTLMIGWRMRQWVGLASLGFVPGMMVGFLALAVMEELLFRGLAQSVFIGQWGAPFGILATAGLFAVMHFCKVPSDYQPAPVTWSSGWIAVGLSFVRVGHFDWVGGYLVVLLLLSGVLSLTRLIFQDLGLVMGLHAGLIIGKSFIDHGTQPLGMPRYFNQSLESHPFTQILLFLVLMLLIFQYQSRAKRN